MTQEQLVTKAFIEACKYISKKNFELDDNTDMEEISIKAFYGGSNDEWKYWADYFIEKVKGNNND
jgi:hypothetical protein